MIQLQITLLAVVASNPMQTTYKAKCKLRWRVKSLWLLFFNYSYTFEVARQPHLHRNLKNPLNNTTGDLMLRESEEK
jgi:hypothetical protein